VSTRDGQIALKLILLQSELFPNPPMRPLISLTEPPIHESYAYESSAGSVESDLYPPSTGGVHTAALLYTGIFGLRRDAAIVRIAEGLARTGVIVMVPESTTLRSGNIVAGETDTIHRAVTYLRQRADVDPEHIGVFGFSVGGSLVLVAAEQESDRDDIAFVSVSGAYVDARDLIREVTTRTMIVDGQILPWTPSEIASYTVARQIIIALPDAEDTDILWRAVLDHDPSANGELDRLSEQGQLVLEILRAPSPDRADEILRVLDTPTDDRLTYIPPGNGIEGLHARLYVLHDRGDTFVPFTHSRRLAMVTRGRTLRYYAETELFEHVTPDVHPGLQVFAREFPTVTRYLWLLGHELF
jgi:pimeloyl-ACP methyl ester carboxylesterase